MYIGLVLLYAIQLGLVPCTCTYCKINAIIIITIIIIKLQILSQNWIYAMWVEKDQYYTYIREWLQT